MKVKRGVSLVFLGWLLSVSGFAFDAGWIDHFEGKSDHYLIKRGNETVPVNFFTVLQVGDKIIVNKQQHTIILGLRGGTQFVRVTLENSPFTVSDKHQVPAELDTLWTWTKQYLDEWQKFTQSVAKFEDQPIILPVPTKPKLPLLKNVKESTMLVAGQRPLYLQWYGGEPPYQVHIQQRRHLMLSKISTAPTIKTEAITFDADKSYSVKIIDANGGIFWGGFKIAHEMPTKPSTSAANWPDNFRRTLQATWLAKQENGKWIFEAYQQVAHLTDYPPAQLLKQALAYLQETQSIRGIRG
jgi:hypothetical protein